MGKSLLINYRILAFIAIVGAVICAPVQAQENTAGNGASSAIVDKGQSLQEFIGDIYNRFDKRDFQVSGQMLDEKLIELPGNKRVRSLSALRYSFQKKWKEFFNEVEKIYKLKAENPKEEALIRDDIHTWFAVAYDEGIQLARDGKFSDGLFLLENLAKHDYRTELIQIDLIVISTWQKKYDKAISEYEQLDPKAEQPDYLLKAMVDAYREKDMTGKLLGIYEKYLRANPDDLPYRKAAYETALSVENYQKAYVHNEFLRKSDPGNSQYIGQMADILLNQNDPIKALEHLSKIPKIQLVENFRPIQDILNGMTDDQYLTVVNHIKTAGPDYLLPTAQCYIIVRHFSNDQVSFDGYREFKLRMESQFDRWPLELQVEFAELYMVKELNERAENYYASISERAPDHFDVNYGLAGIFFRKQRWNDSKKYIQRALNAKPKDIDALFLKGKILDSAGEYWESVKNYDTILKYYPDNDAALNLKSRAQMDMGSSSLITEATTEKAEKFDSVIANRAQGDIAMQFIKWDEPKLALEKIDALIAQYEEEAQGKPPEEVLNEEKKEYFLRAKWDRFLALRQDSRMKEVIDEYELAQRRNLNIPPWVRRAVADAYLYLEEPHKSLVLYEQLVIDDPDSYEIRMALYYNLVDLGRFERASEVIDQLDRDLPKATTERGVIDDNWKKANVAISKGWLLMYQDRLKEAENYIDKLLVVSPANSGLRTAQAQNHLWRGWPRLALDEFKLVRTMDDRNVSAQIGHAMALNSNMHKQEARDAVDAIVKKFPKNKHALRAQRLFDVEDMTKLTIDGTYEQEFPGEDEYVSIVRVDEPITHHHTLFGYWYRRETTNTTGNDVTKRIYLGDQWQPDNFWKLTGALSFDDDGGNVGYRSDIVVTPNDYLTFGFGYESEFTSIPLRSRSAGVSAENYSWSAVYRASELFNTGLNVSYVDFSDGNENINLLWTTDTAITTAAHWKTRIGTEFSYADFSSQNVAYFSPEHVYAFYVIPMVEHVWFRRYESALIDRLYVGFGQNWQSDFNAHNLGYVQYEHDYQFSETKKWLIGTRYNLNQYDGGDVNSLNFYTTLQTNF